MAEYTKYSSVRLFADDIIIYLILTAENDRKIPRPSSFEEVEGVPSRQMLDVIKFKQKEGNP